MNPSLEDLADIADLSPYHFTGDAPAYSQLGAMFSNLGSQTIGIENHTAAGLQQDHDNFLQQKPPAEAVSMFVLHSGYQSECLEIAAYHDLIDKANSLGLQDCV